ncbi:GH3 auxin-responsive promoter family protein [Sunxiuqinia elliptica]|uniref:GH3 auxin-responsive promoter n=1 Tax=Sunxiuqinia elliptica TaxID=655355 RepID=A0A4R6H6Y2_9BACT|nr:GH3 auxin-responsive promoter family protein [Sunxiuqinia elliptica]TDO03225.1 GH3 auxin-responsive promoter [Sunxiuqinia elliptica]TDO59422.1 GH3 auxin-responsive promoter [Sunxiuqinia elliptica]
MALIGAIIKKAIELGHSLSSTKEFHEEQKRVLHELLVKAKDTQFGTFFQFQDILLAQDLSQAFASRVPFFDYHQMETNWWYRLHQGEENVSWPGKPAYFALSSGTTGKKSKRIPVTDEMLNAIRMAGIKQVGATANFNLPPSFFEKEILMLGSSTKLNQRNGYLEGEISGISASNIPAWFKGFYRPGEEISKINDWDERVLEIAKRAKEWDIGAISGIPSWLELMMKKVMDYHHAKTIHEIWPNLQVYTTGGVAFEPFEKNFNKLFAHPITIIDTYFASEGFLAFQERPDTRAMKLLVDNGIYFEFVPFEPENIQEDGSLVPDAPVLNLTEVQEGQDYVLLISTVAGLWRYIIGDTIRFSNVDRAEIKITGRTKFFLNVVGSQLSVQKMNAAMLDIEQQFDMTISEFTVAAIQRQGEYHHCWYLGTDSHLPPKKIEEALDQLLKEANKNYRVARSKALKSPEVHLIPNTCFHDWNAQNKKKGGQVKMEKVMNENRFQEWETFVSDWLNTHSSVNVEHH